MYDTNMSEFVSFRTALADFRKRDNLSQDQLASLCGLSRAEISAIETGRVVPSTAAALSLAQSFGCRVEDLFTNTHSASAVSWAWTPTSDSGRYWSAQIENRTLAFPVERTQLCPVTPDGSVQPGTPPLSNPLASRRLVVAGCDPAVGLLQAALTQSSSTLLLPYIRSSGHALDLLEAGVVHLAGIHLGNNSKAVEKRLGKGYILLRVAEWEVGIAHDLGLNVTMVRELAKRKIRWVMREPGSGAQSCLNSLIEHGDVRPPNSSKQARDHWGVCEAIRCGWAQAGISVRLTAEEAALGFINVKREVYDLCFKSELQYDPRLMDLIRVIRSKTYKTWIETLPGYGGATCGDIVTIN
jgi:molybdate-binding protein/DNA-binding XRE family transcriptional regulator